MTLRAGHGRGAGSPRVEVLPPDELPRGVQARPVEPKRAERDAKGRLRPGSRTTQSAGGKARREATQLAAKLGLSRLGEGSPFAGYKRAGAAFKRFHIAVLAKSVGGGHCGPGPASIVATAAWQLAASRYLFDLAAESGDREDFALASKLANDSRQNLLAAHELCAREAQARAAVEGDSLAQQQLAFQRQLAERQAAAAQCAEEPAGEVVDGDPEAAE